VELGEAGQGRIEEKEKVLVASPAPEPPPLQPT